MKKIRGNLVLDQDTTFEESIEVEGNISGKYNLTVLGDIKARNIEVRDINAWNIRAEDIKARDIIAQDIDASHIDYHTFCIVYDNIHCTSITGRRKNAFH